METTPIPPQDGFPQSPPHAGHAPEGFPHGFPGATPHSPRPAPSPPEPPARQPWTRPEDDLPDTQRLRSTMNARARRHGDPVVTRAWRAAARAVLSDSFPDDYAQAVAACQQSVTTGRRIGILSPVGGAGRSTLAAAMGLLLSSARLDHIAAVDLAGRPSGLPSRLPAEAGPSAGLKALARLDSAQHHDSLDALDSCAALTRENLRCLSLLDREAPLEAEDLPPLYQLFSRSCAVTLLELPALSSGHAREAMRNLHAVVLAVPPQPAAIDAAQLVLDTLREASPVTPVIPALVNTAHAGGQDRHMAASSLRARMRAAGHTQELHRVDADRHLGAGGPLQLARVGERRRLQLAQLTSAALGAAQGGPR